MLAKKKKGFLHNKFIHLSQRKQLSQWLHIYFWSHSHSMALVLRLLGLSDELLNDFISLWFTGCMDANSVNSILFVTSEWTDSCNPTIYLCYLYIQILRSNSWLLDFASCLLRCTMLNLQIYHLLLFVLLFVVISIQNLHANAVGFEFVLCLSCQSTPPKILGELRHWMQPFYCSTSKNRSKFLGKILPCLRQFKLLAIIFHHKLKDLKKMSLCLCKLCGFCKH